MFITGGRTNYDMVLDELLAAFLEGRENHDEEVRFLGETWRVGREGVYSGALRADSIGAILVLRYLLQRSDRPPEHEWVPYREFREGRNFAPYIKAHIEDHLAREFSGCSEMLKNRIEALGGVECPIESNPDLSMAVPAFPSIPVLLVFWDEDEEFGASFQFLFDRSAPWSLDMESLAVLLHYVRLRITEDSAPSG
jgi:hypothetical protein